MWYKKSLSVLDDFEKRKFFVPERFADSEEKEVF